MKKLTVKDLIEQLKKFDGEKTVYVDDTADGEMVGVRGAYGIEAENSISMSELHGHVYLGMVD